jgi:hypothetical protein
MHPLTDRRRPPAAIETLESRLFMSVAPSVAPGVDPMRAPATRAPLASGPTLTLADRQELLKAWQGSNLAQLQADLTAGDTAAFDQHLLDYMKTRTTAEYFFAPSDATGILNFIDSDQGLRNQRTTKINTANKIVSHLFPQTVSSSVYDVQLPAGTIDWINQPAATTNTEFRYTLNRHFFWADLGMAYRFTGDSKYITELRNQLDSWSRQYTRLSNPDAWIATDVRPKWDLFTTSERVKNWMYAYHLVLGTGGWTAGANSLFLHRLLIQGDFMSRTTKVYEPTGNKHTGHGTALYSLGMMFPEFKQAAGWEEQGRGIMFGALDAQFRADGGHYEQSPGYHGGAMGGFFDAFRLAEINDRPWSDKATRKLRRVIEAFYQLLSPDGNQAALSDTYRNQGTTFFTQAAIAFDDPRWPRSRPRLDDCWQLGVAACTPLLSSQTNQPLAGRGPTAYFPDSGYYVTRTGDDRDARQLTFDAGPRGGDHGHLDLLNVELYGYGKPLIADPGLLSYSKSYAAERARVVSTPAHNTISIDNVSHASSERSSIAALTLWSRKPGGVQMAATHYAYQGAKGAPVMHRNVWHDRGDVFLIVDFGNATATHTYSQSFNLFTNNTTKFSGGKIRTATGTGDVMLQPLLQAGQTASWSDVTLSNTPPPDGSATGLRFAVSQSGRSAVFATLAVAFDNGSVPNVSAEWIRMPTAARSGQIKITNNGVETIIYIPYPNLAPTASAKRAIPATADAKSAAVTALVRPPLVSAFATTGQAIKFSADELFAVVEE